MQIDVNMLKSNVNPQLDKAKGTLKDCNAILTSIVVPDDFEGAGKVRDASRKILNIISILSIAQQSVQTSVNKFESTTAKNNQVINNLGNLLRKLKWNRKLYGCERISKDSK